MSRAKRAALLFAAFALCGCAIRQLPRAPLSDPVYPLPHVTLEAKAAALHARLVSEHLNDDGHLLYAVQLPLRDNYQASHASADLPTWHGIWLSSEAFRLALTRDPRSARRIHAGVSAVRRHFACTGVTGLLARSYVAHASELPLDWMRRYNPEDYPTKYWRQGQDGCWFRTGVAKGHYTGALLGLASVVGLEQRGVISLPVETSQLVRRTAIDLVHHVIHGGYRIRDFDGETTEFGKLSDWRINGFSAVAVTAWLRLCEAAGDQLCAGEYARIAGSRSVGIGTWLYGELVELLFGRVFGPAHGWYKPNDSIHTASNAFSHWLVALDPARDGRMLRRNRRLLDQLASLAHNDRNPYFNYIYALLSNAEHPRERADALATLRMFPADKRSVECSEQRSRELQWIANLRINSHYWKTRWHKRCEGVPGAPRQSLEYSAQDYLWAYYVGRFYGFVTAREASAPVDWRSAPTDWR